MLKPALETFVQKEGKVYKSGQWGSSTKRPSYINRRIDGCDQNPRVYMYRPDVKIVIQPSFTRAHL